MVLAEKSGVDREAVMRILSSSIFDCLIYKVHLCLEACMEWMDGWIDGRMDG